MLAPSHLNIFFLYLISPLLYLQKHPMGQHQSLCECYFVLCAVPHDRVPIKRSSWRRVEWDSDVENDAETPKPPDDATNGDVPIAQNKVVADKRPDVAATARAPHADNAVIADNIVIPKTPESCLR